MLYLHSMKRTILLLFSLVAPMNGMEYRVSNAAELALALSTARPGDTLTLTNGVWTDQSLMFAGYGTPSAPIILRAESYGGVVLTGTSTLRISGRHLVVDGLLFRDGYSASGAVVEFRGSNGESDSCRLTNCSIIDYNPAVNTTDYKWISLYGTHNRVDHCYLRGKKHSGTTLVVWLSAKPNYHRIDSNYFAERPPLGVNGGETIRVGTSDWSMYDSYTTVEYNLFEKCNGEIEAISNKSCENVYRGNTFVDCQATLTLRHGNRCVVEGNFFFGNHRSGSGGIRIIGEDHKVYNNYIQGTAGSGTRSAISIMDGVPNSALNQYFQVKRAMIVHNTFVDNRYTFTLGAQGDGTTLPPDSCIITNNVVYSTHSPLITLTDTPTNLTWQGNVFYGAPLGITQPPGIAITDPQLALAADGIWRPGATSPVLNAAVGAFPYITLDMDGQARDATPDVGADEFSAAAKPRRPLTAADVGPPPAMITGIAEDEIATALPEGFELKQNYPNPFNPETVVSYILSVASQVDLRVYDMLGREVKVLVAEEMPAGMHHVTWNAARVASGIYNAVLRVGEFRSVRKLILLK